MHTKILTLCNTAHCMVQQFKIHECVFTYVTTILHTMQDFFTHLPIFQYNQEMDENL